MKGLNIFLYKQLEEILRTGLSSVGENYYKTVYKNIEEIQAVLGGRMEFEDGVGYRFGERIFCYEFYHQLRLIIEKKEKEFPDIFGEAILQGEVKKIALLELSRKFDIGELGGDYAPDLLIHTPGCAETHTAVIEIKASPHLTPKEIFIDLSKIDEFIKEYKYEFGFFIAVNINPEELQRKLLKRINDISTLSKLLFINIICKEHKDAKPLIINLRTFVFMNFH
jgi:hypothetical protein